MTGSGDGALGRRQDRWAEGRAHLRDVDVVLRGLIDRFPDYDPDAWRLELPEMDPFGVLIFQVAGQQLSVAATRTVLGRIEAHFGGRLPSPAQLLSSPSGTLRAAGLSNRKESTLRAIAAQIGGGGLDLEQLRRLDDRAVEAALTSISGVGPWTAHGFLALAFGRQDVFPTGDLVLRRAVQEVFRLDQRPSPADLEVRSAPWRPYRSLAASYLFAALEPGAAV